MSMKRQTIYYLILLASVIMTSIAWSPAMASEATAGAAPSGTLEKSAARRFSARLLGYDLIIDAGKLTPDHEYYVKARRLSTDRWSDVWTRLEVVNSDRRGGLHRNLKLPKNLRKAEILRVCLKDVDTDQVFCTYAMR